MPDDIENLKTEIAALQKENKKMQRQMHSLQGIFDRNKLIIGAQSNLRAVMMANKTKQEKYLKLLLANAPDIIMIFDQYGRFAYCTDSFLQVADIKNFGLINGRTYQEVFGNHSEDGFIKRVEDALARAAEEKSAVSFDAAVDFSRRNKPRNYSIQVSAMRDETGDINGGLLLFHDLTELLNAKTQAEQANRAKSDFLASMSHEIRTPLNAIMGFADILKNSNLEGEQRIYIQNIQNSSHVLLTLINDILDFSKIEAGKLEIIGEYFELKRFFDHLRSIFTLMFKQKGLNFTVNIAGDIPEVVMGDEKRLTEVLTNILNNALKYTNEGFVTFNVRKETGDIICFEVSDTGIGIKKEDMPRLFSAFEQFDKVKNKKKVGAGLGLAITKKLTELMKGTVSVESTYGEGSKFSIRIPLTPGTPADLKYESEIVYNFTAPNAKVLLVDDIDINLMVAGTILQRYGIIPDTALNGAEAIEKVSEKDYDLVFMDHMMPEMDGVEATRKIRAMGGKYAELPIVALTANAINGAEEMFMSNEFNGFLAKPIDSQELAACLLKWLPAALIDNGKE
ncbi:MAG: response regulator [Endomicrobium sp.]|jgi:signal transduction histidine kinase/CheY-like chemotaxis protein|nr:response regulator [Endomicrobium sp.]